LTRTAVNAGFPLRCNPEYGLGCVLKKSYWVFCFCAYNIIHTKIFWCNPRKIMSTIIAMCRGRPTITLHNWSQYADAENQKITARRALEIINSGTAGDPTKVAVLAGLIKKSWPYRLADETATEFEVRSNNM
jgi:hypothetical protein